MHSLYYWRKKYYFKICLSQTKIYTHALVRKHTRANTRANTRAHTYIRFTTNVLIKANSWEVRRAPAHKFDLGDVTAVWQTEDCQHIRSRHRVQPNSDNNSPEDGGVHDGLKLREEGEDGGGQDET